MDSKISRYASPVHSQRGYYVKHCEPEYTGAWSGRCRAESPRGSSPVFLPYSDQRSTVPRSLTMPQGESVRHALRSYCGASCHSQFRKLLSCRRSPTVTRGVSLTCGYSSSGRFILTGAISIYSPSLEQPRYRLIMIVRRNMLTPTFRGPNSLQHYVHHVTIWLRHAPAEDTPPWLGYK
jgi:hypothetical protein